MFAGKKSAQIREILISESAWEEMTCLFAPSLGFALEYTKAYAILEVWSLLAAAGDTFPALIEKDRIYLLQLISGKNNIELH